VDQDNIPFPKKMFEITHFEIRVLFRKRADVMHQAYSETELRVLLDGVAGARLYHRSDFHGMANENSINAAPSGRI
jgi:hypothetical protein